MHSIPVLPPLVAQRPIGEGHAPARLAGQGLGVFLHYSGWSAGSGLRCSQAGRSSGKQALVA